MTAAAALSRPADAPATAAAGDPAAGISIENLVKVYASAGEAPVTALGGVSIRIAPNEFFTLLGPSGCGKTTLLRSIAGFEQPSSGRVVLDGVDITGEPPFRRPINTVFQNYALFPHMTVAQNVAFGLEKSGLTKEAITARVDEMLALVHLTGMQRRMPSQLSGGQQQRVALARALAPHPKVLLLDEPLSALDLKLRKGMQIELKRLQRDTGITFVFVTHDQEEALTMSDRIAVMKDGHVLQIGAPQEIYQRPQVRFVADFIGETNFLKGTLQDIGGGRFAARIAGAALPVADPRGHQPGETVTLAVRPERTFLAAAGSDPAAAVDATLAATVDTIVYFGTDTTYHLRVDGLDEPLVARVQNRDQSSPTLAQGARVRVGFPPDALSVLRD
ncbi:ABC transporter ATP-binding protein [Caenispirillum bisanense]|uniref:ABC transporter ATP-binding protein n=1 Tax=Caenispirillum bisanense TaxID=414052 RepID=UPI0031CFA216